MTQQVDISSYDDLSDALCDMRGISDEARDEGFPLPSGSALEDADRLLRNLYTISPRRYEVYPTRDGEIAIDAPSGAWAIGCVAL